MESKNNITDDKCVDHFSDLDHTWEELDALEKEFFNIKNQKTQDFAKKKVEELEGYYLDDFKNIASGVGSLEQIELAKKTDRIINSIRRYGKETFDLDLKDSSLIWERSGLLKQDKNSENRLKNIKSVFQELQKSGKRISEAIDKETILHAMEELNDTIKQEEVDSDLPKQIRSASQMAIACSRLALLGEASSANRAYSKYLNKLQVTPDVLEKTKKIESNYETKKIDIDIIANFFSNANTAKITNFYSSEDRTDKQTILLIMMNLPKKLLEYITHQSTKSLNKYLLMD